MQSPEVTPVVAVLTPLTLFIASFCVVIVFLALVALFNRRKSSQRGDALLLVGTTDSGKTATWSTLVYGQSPQTHTSLQANFGVYTLPESKKTVGIIDVPGHPRLRDQFEEHLPSAGTVAFVVDASAISRNASIVAESVIPPSGLAQTNLVTSHLHHVLHALTSSPSSQFSALIILAHKVDLLKTLSSSTDNVSTLAINRVKTILERELEKRRLAQTGSIGIEGLGAEGEKSELGGLECSGAARGSFKFDEWDGGEITFLATSTKAESEDEKSNGLSQLVEWLEEHYNKLS
ncbi:hypothetical protein AMATHDRAFT_51592 [Amanita thiersii Skay4041]|uniref:Signal recognition particle receptor subunit beta n=1 Tax=Amanita thiersii Skay4041 TaxID=703135 RepID=A0A2A9NBE2_9AGAR|nr:hypothetical protein AMATHDRAFT_51592 [Amanita thiersii Skay4041]